MRPWALGLLTTTLTFIGAFVVLGFITLLVYTTITPAREGVQDFAVCRGADRVDREDTRTTVRRSGASGYQETGATTTDLTCHFGDDVRHVGNDSAFLRGAAYAFGGTAILSLTLATTLGLLTALRRRRRFMATA